MTVPALTVKGQQYVGIAVVALAVLAVVFVTGRCAGERAGKLGAEATQLKANVKTEQAVVVHDSVVLVKHDTVKVFQNVTRSDTVLQRLIDLRHDTVLVTREVLIEAKAALDSTKTVATACCQLARDYKAKAASLDSLNQRLAKLIPWSGKPWLDRGEGVLVCAAAVWGAGKLKN